MILLTHDLRVALRVNAVNALVAQARDEDFDPVPMVKFFSPVSAATWLATELYDDDDTLFGLADLGFGCPELGVFSLAAIAAVRLPFDLRIERDRSFASGDPLSRWAEAARRHGSIIAAEAALRSRGAPELPPGSPDG